VDEDEHRCSGQRQRAEQKRLVGLHRGGRDHGWPKEQDREGVLQPAGQVKQPGKLDKVVSEQQRRPVRVEAVRGREDDP
jgi:hypothetical protein